MSEKVCGDCRYYCYVTDTKPIGICVREDWLRGGISELCPTHYRHVLSADHPAPPCFDGKMKRAEKLGLCGLPIDDPPVRALATEDIKKGEEFIVE